MSSHPVQHIQHQLKNADVFLKKGNIVKAEKILLTVTKKQPGIEAAWLMLASVYGQKGQFKSVIACAEQIIRLNPGNAHAYSMLGSGLAALQQYDRAIETLHKALKLDARNPVILNNLGSVLLTTGKIDKAIAIYRRTLQLNASHPQALLGLANCTFEKANWHEAVTLYRKLVQNMPDNEEINMRLAMSLCNIGELKKAKRHFQQALQVSQQPAQVLYELARISQLLGELQQAKDLITKALRLNPENEDAQAEQVTILYKLGLFNEAHEKILILLERGHLTPAMVIAYGQLCHRYNECQTVIQLAEDLVKQEKTGSATQIELYYLSGKLHDQAAEYDRAFANFELANKLLSGHFDLTAHNKAIQGLIEGYSEQAIIHISHSDCKDERPVFIVGMPRSGTSLVEQILASHKDIYGLGESNEINNIANTLSHKTAYDYAGQLDIISSEKLSTLASQYIDIAEKQAGKALRITDKMPANIFNLGLINQLFPNAHVINCLRDPRDICLSIFFQHFSQGLAFATDLSDIVNYYHSYEKVLSHWKNVLDIPIIDVHYADLITDFENTSRKLLAFLNLDWDENCLNFHQSKRVTATASFDQTRQPVYTTSLQRWQNYKAHIQLLLKEFAEQTI